MSLMTKVELTKATTTWRQAQFGAIMSQSLQLPHTSSNKTGVEKEVSHSSPSDDPVEVRKYCLDNVRGPVHTTWKVTIPPFSTLSVHANSNVKGHYAGPCAHGTDARYPVAYSGSTNGDLHRITSGVLQSTYLSVQLECLYHRNSHKDCGWTGCPYQPSTTGSPPN